MRGEVDLTRAAVAFAQSARVKFHGGESTTATATGVKLVVPYVGCPALIDGWLAAVALMGPCKRSRAAIWYAPILVYAVPDAEGDINA